MAIPDFETIMLPLLQLASDGQEHSLRDATGELAASFKLTEEERRRLVPSGQQEVFHNRIGWAKTYLKKAGLLESMRRGYFRITARGRNVLKGRPQRINNEFLKQFEEFREFQLLKRGSDDKQGKEDELPPSTPEEVLELAYKRLRDILANDLLDLVRTSPPSFFERLVIELLVKWGMAAIAKTRRRPSAGAETKE